MKRLVSWLLPLALLMGCGTAVPVASEEEEVDIGYGTVKKGTPTHGVSSVKVKEDIESYADMYAYLEGRVTGVQVTSDKKIIIRGLGTFNGSSDPLILVDGVEMDDLSSISPKDVKSVDVLKGEAAAIYGMRGANGVIIIKLKH